MVTAAAGSTAAPAWLSYASPAIALLALLVSLNTYRRAGPRIRARMTLVRSRFTLEMDGLLLFLAVRNRGLSPNEVRRLTLVADNLPGAGSHPLHLFYEDVRAKDVVQGPRLPYELGGLSNANWVVDLARVLRRQDPSSHVYLHHPWYSVFGWRLPRPRYLITRFAYVQCAIATEGGPDVQARLSIPGTFRLIAYMKKHPFPPPEQPAAERAVTIITHQPKYRRRAT
jgi:hypothetical protein